MGIRVCDHCANVVDLAQSTLCAKCAKKHGRGTDYKTPWERVVEHGRRYFNAESEEEFATARKAMREACKHWVAKGAK